MTYTEWMNDMHIFHSIPSIHYILHTQDKYLFACNMLNGYGHCPTDTHTHAHRYIYNTYMLHTHAHSSSYLKHLLLTQIFDQCWPLGGAILFPPLSIAPDNKQTPIQTTDRPTDQPTDRLSKRITQLAHNLIVCVSGAFIPKIWNKYTNIWLVKQQSTSKCIQY